MSKKSKTESKTVGTIKFGKFVPAKMYKADFEADENTMKVFAK